MFKKPSSKKAIELGTSLVALEGGRMASRALTPMIPGVTDAKIKSLIVAGLGVAVALAYNGPQKDKVQPFFAGMALEQGGAAKDAALQKALPSKPEDNKTVATLRSTYGLNGSCGCNDGYQQMLNGITAADWTDEYQPDYTPYEEVSNAPGV